MLCPIGQQQEIRGSVSQHVDGCQTSKPADFDGFAVEDTGLSGALLDGRFHIRGFVDQGATARIYLAEDLDDHQPAVVKLFAPSNRHQSEVRARFHLEAQLLMRLHHPNIVQVIAYGDMGDRPYIVVEALRGESLAQYLRREGSMRPELALRLLRHAALGLDAAHRAGVVHRDVKPGNLFLVGPIGAPRGLKVIDWGMATLDSEVAKGNRDLVLGTVEYMAPEQIVSDPVDARTDIYALGVVMFRTMTGCLPFEVDAQVDLLAHQMHSAAPPPSWLAEGLDPRVERIILRAMRKNPEHRQRTMQELLVQIERALGLVANDDFSETTEPPRREADRYEPRTALGRDAAAMLSRRFAAQHP